MAMNAPKQCSGSPSYTNAKNRILIQNNANSSFTNGAKENQA